LNAEKWDAAYMRVSFYYLLIISENQSQARKIPKKSAQTSQKWENSREKVRSEKISRKSLIWAIYVPTVIIF